ncbi:MAG: ankyrin repeat domain-containing protein [Bacteroidia bacterium]|nr:ankyrin repeat domain-containing protein [Bacteroidia bacterium]
MILKRFLFLVLCMFGAQINRAQSIFDAARKGDLLRIELLHKLKPDTILSKNESGFTPLIIAVYRQQNACAALLIKLGADVNVDSPEGPAIMAAVYKHNYELAELLIRHKALLNKQNEDGVTALMYAAMDNQTALVKLLLDTGANKNLVSKSGHTAMSYAKMYDHAEVIKLLRD